MKVHSKQLFYSILFLLIAARIQADEFLYKQMSISEGFPPYIQHIYTEERICMDKQQTRIGKVQRLRTKKLFP